MSTQCRKKSDSLYSSRGKTITEGVKRGLYTPHSGRRKKCHRNRGGWRTVEVAKTHSLNTTKTNGEVSA